MLRKLTFENFKSWPRAELELGPITGLFGTNSSGKTSLIQFILLLKQTKDATDRGISLDLNGSYVTLGAYRDMIHRHHEDSPLSWEMDFEWENELALSDPGGKRTDIVARSKSLRIQSEVRARKMTPECTRLSYSLGNASLSLAPKDQSEQEFDLHAQGGFDLYAR